MIETNMQQQQQDTIFQHLSHPDPETQTGTGADPTIMCKICDAIYAPSPQQAPFLQYAQGALEATFMGMCHFCFRCRRAACPQCWDEVHGVCGSCVQGAGLPFRAGATPLAGLMFPPTSQGFALPPQSQHSALFILVRNGRFYREVQARPEPAPMDSIAEYTSAGKPADAQTGASDGQVADRQENDTGIAADREATETGETRGACEEQIDTPAAVVIPTKIAMPEDPQETDGQEQTPRAAKAQKAKKVSRLELVLTWIVLAIVVALVVTIALAEFIPAVNAAIAHVTHIDIRGEIAYLVHIVQRLFKR